MALQHTLFTEKNRRGLHIRGNYDSGNKKSGNINVVVIRVLDVVVVSIVVVVAHYPYSQQRHESLEKDGGFPEIMFPLR